jgi:steroid Delta-isomerase
MTAETVTNIINEYFAAISALDAERWVATFAADATSYEPGNPLTGHDALRAFFNGIAGGFEQMDMHATEIYPGSNEAGVKWTATGTGKNGRTVKFEGIDVFVINEAGTIQTCKAYWNPAAMMAELMG